MSGNLTSVSTHILDTSIGRPAGGVALELFVRSGAAGEWTAHGASKTDLDGRVKDLPELPEGTTHARLVFATEPYFTAHHLEEREKGAEAQQDAPAHRDSGAFFPEVAVVFAVRPGEHYHVPLLLTPFGYSVYRGS